MTTQWIIFSLFFISIGSWTTSYAESSAQDLYLRSEIQNQQLQLQIEKSSLEMRKMELEQLKMDAELKKREAESDRITAETEKLLMLNAAQDREKEVNARFEQAEEALHEQDDATKTAMEAADEARSDVWISNVRHSNQFYISVFILTLTFFAWILINKYKKEDIMKDHEKYGVIIILASILLILFSLMASAPWIERYDFIQNLMTVLKVSFFAEEDECKLNCTYLIEFKTKYIIFALLTSASYGFTTYLGITPAYKMDLLGISDKSKEKA